MQSPLLQIGTVLRPHGLRGELRVRLHNPASSALERVPHVWLRASPLDAAAKNGTQREWQIEAARPLPDGCYLIALAGVEDRNTAESLRASQVLVERDSLDELDDDEVYLADLVGLSVRTVTGDALGHVKEVLDLNSNILLSVERPGRPELLVPTVPDVLVRVDWAERTIFVDLPEGLLDN